MPNIEDIREESLTLYRNLGLDVFENIAIIASEISGHPCDLVVRFEQTGKEDEELHEIQPLLIVMNPELFSLLTPPSDDEVVYGQR